MAQRTYNMVAVCGHGVVERKVRGAPTDTKLIEFGRKHHAKAVVRFYPKYGGWLVTDIRDAIVLELAGVGKVYRNTRRAMQVFASEDAAVMTAMHKLD